MTSLDPKLLKSVSKYLTDHPIRSEQQAAAEIAAARERNKGLTVFTLEDEWKLRAFEWVMRESR